MLDLYSNEKTETETHGGGCAMCAKYLANANLNPSYYFNNVHFTALHGSFICKPGYFLEGSGVISCFEAFIPIT